MKLSNHMLTVALLVFASVKAQVFICYGDDSCGSETGRGSDQVNCCQHGVAPFGLSYSIVGVQACNTCPIDFGFVNPSFTAQENYDTYPVELAFFSGQSASGGFFLSLDLEHITSDLGDIGFINRVFFPDLSGSNDLEIRTAEIRFRLDSIAQESNETFRLTFSPNSDILPGANLRNSMNGVIVDATRATFKMSAEDYREREGKTGFMPVVITKNSRVFLANPVTFLVIPWTVQQAIDEGLIPHVITVPDSSIFSPNRADASDFNASRIITKFEADVGLNVITDLDVPIPIFDDVVDEANYQYFIAEFRVVVASTVSLISLEQRVSRCRIVDNDRVRIGFQLSQYDYLEPLDGNAMFTNVTLIKENNVESEQTFGLNIVFGDPGGVTNAATLEPIYSQGAFDYVVSDRGDFSLLLQFLPQDSETNFEFTVYADDIAEGTEGFRVMLFQAGDPFPNFALPAATNLAPFQNALIRILDTDYASVGFEHPTYTINENAGSVEVCVILTNPPVAFDIVLLLLPTEVTADNLDFLNQPGAVLFMTGSFSNRTCTNFLIRQDDFIENIEFFNVTLSIQEGFSGIMIQNSVTTVFILNIDSSLVTQVFMCYNDNACGSNNGRETGRDTDAVNCCQHGVEPFGLSYKIEGVNKCNTCPLGIYAALERTEFSVTEADGAIIEVCAVITIDTGLYNKVVVTLKSADRTAQSSSNMDFVAVQSDFIFSPDVRRRCKSISVTDDNIYENSEYFQVILTTTNALVTFDTARQIGIVTIKDNDEITIGFRHVIDSVAENSPGHINLCVTIFSGILEGSVTFSVATADAGVGFEYATADEDYTTSLANFTFQNNSTQEQCLRVPIIFNGKTEGNESFWGILSKTTNNSRLTLEPRRTTITISDYNVYYKPVDVACWPPIVTEPVVNCYKY